MTDTRIDTDPVDDGEATLVPLDPSASASLQVERGDTVGRYVTLRKLGQGGMGVVYLAYDPELDRQVALKLLSARAGDKEGDEEKRRLLREAQALAKLNHPNVVAVHDVGEHRGRVFKELVRQLQAAAAGKPAQAERSSGERPAVKGS